MSAITAGESTGQRVGWTGGVVNNSDGFAFRSSYAAQKKMAELAFSLLTMRASTPSSAWVDEYNDSAYRSVLSTARAEAGDEAEEDLLLSTLNLADALLRILVAATEVEMDEWLARLHRHYIEPIDPQGRGVWGPDELKV